MTKHLHVSESTQTHTACASWTETHVKTLRLWMTIVLSMCLYLNTWGGLPSVSELHSLRQSWLDWISGKRSSTAAHHESKDSVYMPPDPSDLLKTSCLQDLFMRGVWVHGGDACLCSRIADMWQVLNPKLFQKTFYNYSKINIHAVLWAYMNREVIFCIHYKAFVTQHDY